MKYIRKAIAIILAAVFIAAVAIGVSVIFAVRNINVATVSYSSAAGSNDDFTQSVSDVSLQLSSLEGKNLLGLDDDDISSLLPQGGYARFISYEKVYPCTLNVTFEERLETFAVLSQSGGYLIYDEQGAYITSKASNINNLDGCPNVLVTTDGSLETVAGIATLFKEQFSYLRSMAQSIVISESSGTADITLYCGLTLRLVSFTEYTSEKVAALYTAFYSAEDYLKTEGVMECRSDSYGQLYIIQPDGVIYKV